MFVRSFYLSSFLIGRMKNYSQRDKGYTLLLFIIFRPECVCSKGNQQVPDFNILRLNVIDGGTTEDDEMILNITTFLWFFCSLLVDFFFFFSFYINSTRQLNGTKRRSRRDLQIRWKDYKIFLWKCFPNFERIVRVTINRTIKSR